MEEKLNIPWGCLTPLVIVGIIIFVFGLFQQNYYLRRHSALAELYRDFNYQTRPEIKTSIVHENHEIVVSENNREDSHFPMRLTVLERKYGFFKSIRLSQPSRTSSLLDFIDYDRKEIKSYYFHQRTDNTKYILLESLDIWEELSLDEIQDPNIRDHSSMEAILIDEIPNLKGVEEREGLQLFEVNKEYSLFFIESWNYYLREAYQNSSYIIRTYDEEGNLIGSSFSRWLDGSITRAFYPYHGRQYWHNAY